MMRYHQLAHRFVSTIPEKLDPGILYVSMEYATAAHVCCCGCGEEVVTPFTPTDWRMEFDGETISLSPSIGSWTLACRSHYIVRRGRVIRAGAWTDDEVDAERRRDRARKVRYYGDDGADRPKPRHPEPFPVQEQQPIPRRSMLARLRIWFGFG